MNCRVEKRENNVKPLEEIIQLLKWINGGYDEINKCGLFSFLIHIFNPEVFLFSTQWLRQFLLKVIYKIWRMNIER